MSRDANTGELYKLFKKATGKKISFYEKLELDHAQPSKQTQLKDLLDDLLGEISWYYTQAPPTVEERLANLEQKVKRLDLLEEEIDTLKKNMDKKEPPHSIADVIYETNREMLEKNHFGEIVAIDIEASKIVSFGNTILEAYENARKISKKKKFSFKKVGSPVICKLR